MDLVIVESPAKAKTIEKYLGSNYKVEASVGHIIDLPAGKLGVDIENNFTPTYTVIKGKQKVIDSLKKIAKKASTIYLAPDPDREGEAIAWHIAEQIKGKPIKRVLFNEITKEGILKGISNPCDINENRVKAQQSRRILDRLVGYLVSPLLWKPLKSGLSAGRVQSVALRLVCERENEIETFIPVESWSIEADFEIKNKTGDDSGILKAKLDKIDGKKAELKTEDDAKNVIAKFPDKFNVSSVEKKEVSVSPAFPFTTSRMQQEAIKRLGFSAKRVMMLAQQLYEGIELGKEGPVGLITYMRTDSVRISPEATTECADFIEKTYGNDYLPKKKRVQKKASANVQDAHEAIRPTSVFRTPNDVKEYLSNEHYRLYKLIWERFVASQMAEAIYDQTTVIISGNNLDFRASARVLKFAGFSALYMESNEENTKEDSDEDTPILFDIEKDNNALLKSHNKKQHFTQSPPRYTEASLVKTLEQQGIGRPSTYASIISVIIDRKYVELTDKKFRPTELGRIVNTLLITNFPKIFEVKFTAEMEKDLDLIEEGKEDWIDVLSAFYKDFDRELKTASSGKLVSDLLVGKTCPQCNKAELIVKYGRNGAFLACSDYPDCSFTSDFKREENGEITIIHSDKNTSIGIMCEKCGKELVIKRSRYGEMVACSGYPECKNIKNFIKQSNGKIRIIEAGEEVNKDCPKCNGKLIVKSGRNGMFVACGNYPECKYTASLSVNDDGSLGVIESNQDTSSGVCEKCGKPMTIKRGPRGPFLACSGYPECKNVKSLKK